MVFQINYKKTKLLDIESLANSFESDSESDTKHNYNPFHISNLQNYNPHYSVFFELNESNYNSITFNHEYLLSGDKIVHSTTGKPTDKTLFVKFSPLLDPIRYLTGKYNINDPSLRVLPNLTNKDKCFPKISSVYNVSYNDSFFSFLSSKLIHEHNYVHGVDYFGSYLGIQELFKTIVTDDLEYLHDSEFFMDHIGKEFFVSTSVCNDLANIGSRGNKHRISIGSEENMEDFEVVDEIEGLNQDPDQYQDVQKEDIIEKELEQPEIENCKQENKDHSDSESSNGDHLNYSDDEEYVSVENQNENNEIAEPLEIETELDHKNELQKEYNSGYEEGSSSKSESDSEEDSEYETDVSSRSSNTEEEEEEIYAYIKDFPVQLICQERCDGTLDQMFEDLDIDDENGAAYMMQIVMMLIILQKAFDFTHNDLHTNNIMYVETDKEYLYYKYENQYYKVPTHGRILKIIDFGRAIYKYKGNQYCSDSFAVGGDAYSQYNFEPFFNPKKPKIEPNPSFDLCRLACSIYDFIIDDDDNEEELDEMQQTIKRWCTDDNGKNVLYKSNGEERYPDFKLYKMIARNVHNHVPKDQLQYPIFKNFKISKNKLKTKAKIIDIDEIPVYA